MGVSVQRSLSRACFNGQAPCPADLLIHGADGVVGVAAMQFARARGTTIIATVGSEQRGASWPAGRVPATSSTISTADHVDRILAFTDGRGVDVIIETLASVNLGKDLPLPAPGGRVAIIGSRGPVEINPRDHHAV